MQVESRKFGITRGTKQGDPMSPSLFNAVLETVFQKLKQRWDKQQFGIAFNNSTGQLSNLRFADDVILVATSRAHLKQMIQDLLREAAKVGLQMNMGETKILTNGESHATAGGSIRIDGQSHEIIAGSVGTMYLGRYLSVQDSMQTELEHRLQKAWRAFFAHKKHLCNKPSSVQNRLKLFNAVVTAAMLYGCGTWTLNKGPVAKTTD